MRDYQEEYDAGLIEQYVPGTYIPGGDLQTSAPEALESIPIAALTEGGDSLDLCGGPPIPAPKQASDASQNWVTMCELPGGTVL